MTRPGRPRVVARCGRNPVPKIDAILKYGQPSTQVLSYEIRLTRSTTSPAPAIRSPTSRIQPSPPPKQTRMVAIVATMRSPVSRMRERPDDEAEDAREEGAGHEVVRDEIDAGDARCDGALEVGEPVVGQRHAGEVGDFRREVAGRDARADRDVDQQVAPVPAAADPAVGRLVPAVAHQDDEHGDARAEGDDPGRRIGPEGGEDAGSGRARDRRQPAMTELGDEQRRERQDDRADDDRLADRSRPAGRRRSRGGTRRRRS